MKATYPATAGRILPSFLKWLVLNLALLEDFDIRFFIGFGLVFKAL